MRLVPSLWRSTLSGVGTLLIVLIASYLLQGYVDHKWWSLDYLTSLLIPIAIFPVFVWFAFVPKELEFNDQALDIQFHFRKRHNLLWNALTYWGRGQGVFVMQFGTSSFQIYS